MASIRSMTGFGRADLTEEGVQYNLEVRSVNHRFLEINLRLPKEYMVFEGKVRKMVGSVISRGRLDIYLDKNPVEERGALLTPNLLVISELVNMLRHMKKEFNLSGGVGIGEVLYFKDMIFTKERRWDEAKEWKVLERLLNEALNSLIDMRQREGEAIYEELMGRIDRVSILVAEISQRSPQVIADFKERLKDRITSLGGEMGLDEARLAQEVAIYAMRSDISEELSRIEAHLTHMRDCLSAGGPVGRRMEFILQEVNREVNTLSAKSADLPINLTVEIRTELERIREQAQNLE